MSRKLFSKRGDKWVGEFPPEGGWQKGRRGIRRTLCSVSSLSHMSEEKRYQKLIDQYKEVQRDLLRDQEKQKEIQRKERKDRKNWTAQRAGDQWLESVSTDNSDITIKDYKRTITLYVEACGNHPLKEFGRLHYDTFLNHLKKQRGKQPGTFMAASTRNKFARQLQVFLNWAYDMDIIDKLQKLKKPKTEKKDMDTYEPEDLLKIRNRIEQRMETAVAEGDRREMQQMKNAMRVWWLATYSLMRLGALWSLKLENINLERGTIHIKSNPDLGWENKKKKWPIKPISPKLMEFLKEDLASRDKKEKYFLDKGNGLPWYRFRGDISKLFGELCEECNLPKLKPLHHGFRATMITKLLNDDADPQTVQQLADHDDLATTLSYRDSRKTKQQKAADHLNNLI
ncbi:tyrosine-type recombinase/integrase [Endozoicomonas sp. GU-1]|uniref:tyrosine-type recombinase/integrase n=1 Tax=Endozoicomonas sp. GU-1 TaxID=3009078 RepID=UPI0022B5421A|nr:site-specific integrase [Endozoicomonas sp. GU-1]WBA86491.1 site-specific integrase [Endozoicomonas sp. GU-1]